MTFAPHKFLTMLASLGVLASAHSVLGQESIDLNQLVDELNERIVTIEPGVTIRTEAPHGGSATGNLKTIMIGSIPSQVPDFAIVARDRDGQIQDIFGPQTPYEIKNGAIAIPGYVPPQGGSLELAGAETWVNMVAQADTNTTPVMDKMFDPLVGLSEVVQHATAFLAERLCDSAGRPSEISMYLNAEFKFIIGGETGTEVTWNFDEVCSRLGYDDTDG